MAQTSQVANTLTGSEFTPWKSRSVKFDHSSGTLYHGSVWLWWGCVSLPQCFWNWPGWSAITLGKEVMDFPRYHTSWQWSQCFFGWKGRMCLGIQSPTFCTQHLISQSYRKSPCQRSRWYTSRCALDIPLMTFFWGKRTQLRYLGMVSMLYVLHCVFYTNARINNRFFTGGKPLTLLRILALHGNQYSSGDGIPRLRQALTCIM